MLIWINHYQILWGPLSGCVTSFAHIFLTITGLDSFLLAMWSAQRGKCCVLFAPTLPECDGFFCLFDLDLTASCWGQSQLVQLHIGSGHPAWSASPCPPWCTWFFQECSRCSAFNMQKFLPSEADLPQMCRSPSPLFNQTICSNGWLAQITLQSCPMLLLVLHLHLLSLRHSEPPLSVVTGVWVPWVEHISIMLSVSVVSYEQCQII